MHQLILTSWEWAQHEINRSWYFRKARTWEATSQSWRVVSSKLTCQISMLCHRASSPSSDQDLVCRTRQLQKRRNQAPLAFQTSSLRTQRCRDVFEVSCLKSDLHFWAWHRNGCTRNGCCVSVRLRKVAVANVRLGRKGQHSPQQRIRWSFCLHTWIIFEVPGQCE